MRHQHLEMRDILLVILIQNEAILALLEKRESKLTPEDQEMLNEAFRIEKRDIKAIDDAMK